MDASRPRDADARRSDLLNALAVAKARAELTARRVRRVDALSRDHIAADLATIAAAADRAAAAARALGDRPPAPARPGRPRP